MIRRSILLLMLSGFIITARAGVTNLVWYRLGDNDPNPFPSAVVTNTLDFMGGAPLRAFGTPRYNNAVDLNAEATVGTAFGIGFNGNSQSLSNGPIFSATNSFCVEMWVRPQTITGGPYFIAGNGNLAGGGNGWGIFQQGADFKAVLGGLTTIEPVLLNRAVVGQWTHLALVQELGMTILYVDGLALGSTFNHPRPPTIGFTLGTHPQLPAGEFFNGTVDEVRVFKFDQFSVSDLLISPRLRTLPATEVTATNALLRGLFNSTGLPGSWWFEWGVTTNYGNVTPAQSAGNGAGVTNFTYTLTTSGGVTYHFRAVASNSLTGVIRGVNETFSTPLFTSFGPVLTLITNATVWSYQQHFSSCADYDGDGRLDVLISASNLTSKLWRNTGSGFSNSWNFGGYFSPSCWADFNNDGRLDIVRVEDVVLNTGAGFTTVPSGLPVPQGYGPAGWTSAGDANNDGWLDTLFTGYFVNVQPPAIYLTATRLMQSASGLTQVSSYQPALIGPSAWGDFDADGRTDIALGGFTNIFLVGGLAEIWRNTGNGFEKFATNISDSSGGTLAWGDYDNDGRLDLLKTGGARATEVYRNTGAGFSNIQAGLPAVTFGGAAWGDYDNDGRLDILLYGKTNNVATTGGGVCQVWRNTGSGFANISNTTLPGVCAGTVAWGDFDNDGRLDVMIAGFTNWNSSRPDDPLSRIWRNNTAISNTPPSVPAGLAATLTANSITFRWNASSDAQTPAAGLSYNLRVGTTPGGAEIVSPMSIANGRRQVPAFGNAGQRLSRTIVGLPVGVPIYWSVQAVDNGFAGSSFAPERVVTFNTIFTPTNGVLVPGDLNGDGIVSPTEFGAVLTNVNGNGVLTEASLNLVLSNYFANSPWLAMTNVAGLGGSNVTFALTNSLAGSFLVEYSTNLNSPNWQPLGPATARYLFADTNAPNQALRYYRLRWP
jgi:hypothetical protein